MTIFDSIKDKNIDEFAEWMEEYCSFDDAPWWSWWDENYCNKCDSVMVYVSDWDRNVEFAHCELNGNCRFFQEMKDVPNTKHIIKMWLESKHKE